MHFIVRKPYLNLKNESIQYKESTATRIKGKNHEIRMLGKTDLSKFQHSTVHRAYLL